MLTLLKSQFRKTGLIGTGAVAAAMPVPRVTVEAASTVNTEAQVPKPVSVCIMPVHSTIDAVPDSGVIDCRFAC
ncbi:hypothetical protein ACX9NF_00020 [Mycobacterium sp. ML1]